MTPQGILFALMIFVLRIINNSISTINVIATVRQQRILAAVMTFLESLIWVVVIADVIDDLQNMLNLMAYSAGFAAGNYVGIIVQERFMTNYVNTTLIAPAKGHEIALALRHNGYGVTETSGEGHTGKVCVLHSVMRREDLPELLQTARGINPDVFVSVEPVRAVQRGWIRHGGRVAGHLTLVFRWVARWTLVLTVIFAGLTAVVHALAYDHPYYDGLRAFLMPDADCTVPCFMGIRPGVTTADEAIAMLEAHDWVRKVRTYLELPRTYDGLICWEWSGRQPAFIDPKYYASPCLHTTLESSIIAGITIPTVIPFGDLWVLERPENILVNDYTAFYAEVVYTANFLHKNLHGSPTPFYCPVNLDTIWNQPTLIEFGAMSESYIASRSTAPQPDGDLRTWLRKPPC